jgi:hypothetical protein
MERDKTNEGAAFPPFPEQKFILQGKLDVNGDEENIAIITAESKDGSKRLEVYRKVGVLFENDQKDTQKEGAPDYSGPFDMGINLRIAGWRKQKDDKKYMSFQLTQKQNGSAPQPQPTSQVIDGDDIPF